MPSYNYECSECGFFTASRPMAEFDRPQACPECGRMSPRLLTAPALGGGAVQESTGAAMPRAHAGGCACCAAPRRFSAEAV